MNILLIITLVVFAIEFASLGVGLLCGYIFFNTLEKKYPKYYKRIGRPKIMGYTEYAPTRSDFAQRVSGTNYLYSTAFKGLPANFPNDNRLKRLARILRYLLFEILAFFIVLVVLFFCISRSNVGG